MRIKVAAVDLGESLSNIDGLDGYTSVKGLVRLHRTPVGYIDVPVTNGYCSAQNIRKAILKQLDGAIVRHLLADALMAPQPKGIRAQELVDVHHTADSVTRPHVTVAVCTRNRQDDLRKCLAALIAIDYESFEIVVVDNAPSTDATKDLVASHFPTVRYVREPRPGLDWGRNRAIAEARGEIIAYTDDDVVVDPGWLSAIADAFSDPAVMAVTGLVVPYELETEAQQLFERNGGFGRGFDRRWFGTTAENDPYQVSFLGAGQFGTGANMAYRREVFDAVGVFDPALDVGTVTNGGGDLEMFFRVLKFGHVLAYEPAALVYHRHRREYAELKSQLANNGVGFYAHLVRAALVFPDERVRVLRMAVWWLWWWSLRRLLISYIRPARFPRDLVFAELKGSFVGLTRYQQARRNARKIARDVARYGPVRSMPRPPKRAAPQRRRQELRVAVRNIDVAKPLAAISDIQDYDAVRLIVTRGSRPLGDTLVASYGQPLSIRRLRESLAAQLPSELMESETASTAWERWADVRQAIVKRLLQPSATTDTSAILPDSVGVSVYVATRNRPEDLRQCLATLVTQQTRRPVEIIVVDNDPDSGITAPVVAEFKGVRLVTETRPGVSYARNAGIAASNGEIIVSADDDITAPPEWLETLIAPLARADVMIVTGNTLPIELDTKAQQLFEQYGGLGRGYEPLEADRAWFNRYRKQAVPTWVLGGTANAAYRASIFADPRIGMLDETLGAGSPAGCSEDTYLFYKVLQAGYTIVYEPTAYAWHRHRRDMPALKKQIYDYSKGHVAYHLTTVVNDGDLRGLFDVFGRLPYWKYKQLKSQVRRGLTGRERYPMSLLVTEALGNLAGPYGFWKSRQRVKRLGRSVPYVPPHRRVGQGKTVVVERDQVAAS